MTPRRVRWLATATVLTLYVIVITGSLVRLTGSGLGCDAWPGCEEGAFFPEDDAHAFIEFGNRIFGIFPITFSILTAWAARHLPLLDVLDGGRRCRADGRRGPLGLATIRYDLPPEIVMVHFLVALLALAGALVVLVEAIRVERGAASLRVPARAADRAVVLAAACLGLVLTGTLVTGAGHSGDPDVIHRLWNLPDALYLHVPRITAVFGCVFLFVLSTSWRRRSLAPRLFRFSLLLLAVLLAQMTVGELQWRLELPWGIVAVRLALAAAVWVLTVALAALIWQPPRWLEPQRG